VLISGISTLIIRCETNPIRFEKYCLAVCELAEGVTFVPTSVNYDQGRDGRALRPAKGTHSHLLCATLNQDIDDKVRKDLDKLSKTSEPDRLLYCCSQKLTERHADALLAAIRKRLPSNCSVAILAADQLGYLAEKYEGAFRAFYKADYENVASSIIAPERADAQAAKRGLRLALVALGSDEAHTLRHVLSHRMVLEVLARTNEPTTPGALAVKLAADLRLPKSPNSAYVQAILAELSVDGFVQADGEKWLLTSAGLATLQTIPAEAAYDLLCGRNVIRQELEELTGLKLDDTQFEQIWSTLLDFLSELFYSNGIEIISAINDLVGDGGTESAGSTNLEKLLYEGAARIKALVSFPDLGDEIQQAIIDIFTERTGPAFEWLSRVCERFVALCALGVETASADAIRAAVRRFHLVLDSDIVLTLLCEGEPSHDSVKEIIRQWRLLGGRVLLAKPILEELAYHAYISDRSFAETKYLLGRLRGNDLLRYVDNAFVRAFHTIEKNPKRWPDYYRQFVGQTPRDYTNILSVLQDEIVPEILPDNHDPRLADKISSYLRQIGTDADGDAEFSGDIGKAGRDGQLLASIAAGRSVQNQLSANNPIVLLSSSKRLRKADSKFRREMGSPEAVVSLGAITFLLSLTPGCVLGAGALRRALFDFGECARLPDVERLALRVIKGSQSYTIPWSKRVALQKNLEELIQSEARKRDISPAVFRRQLASGSPPTRPAELIVSAVKQMAAHSIKEEELTEAHKRIRELEAQLSVLQGEIEDLTEAGGALSS
jgi:hypothetical protein